MKDEDLKRLFDRAEEAPPRDRARAWAREASLAAFDAEHSGTTRQGTVEPFRHTPDDRASVGRRKMTITTQRWMVSGLASAAVVVLGVMLLMTVMPRNEVAQPVSGSRPQSFAEQAAPGPQSPGAGGEGKVKLQEVVVTGSRAENRTAAPRTMNDGAAFGMPPRVMAKAPPRPLFMPAPERAQAPGYHDVGRDRFESVTPNPVKVVAEEPVSTFSIDVDTASYSFVRRELNHGVLPQKNAVRLEEMVNYFDYDYPGPADKSTPFRANITVIDSPWKPGNKLVDIGIKGYDLPPGSWPRSNIVFLLDVSGSMNSPDKLPLVKQSLGLLLSRLKPQDTVAIVAYAGTSGVVLEPTPVRDRQRIMAALSGLHAGGSTAGAAGIRQAYHLAEESFVKNGVNRVILATDGDFNVGITNIGELKGFIERKRKSGIYLSVLGFGQGNYNDELMQELAQNGNGVAAYIDTLAEAQKVLVDEATSALFPIAKDVKIQVEFNPDTVREYRLLGYETRILNGEDFNNDAVDAGDIGAGHTVTAIYEITPVGAKSGLIDGSRYTESAPGEKPVHQNEYGYVKIRYKLPSEDESRLISQPILVDQSKSDARLKSEARFAAAVAGFAQLLQGGKYTSSWNYDDALALARANKGEDNHGYRSEFIQLIRRTSVASDMENQ